MVMFFPTRFRFSSLMKILIFAVFLLEVSSSKADRPSAVEKSSALTRCNASETFPGSIYTVPDATNGHYCCECLPGYYVGADCEDKYPLKTQCLPCPDGYFASEANHNKSCAKFSTCSHLPNTRLVEGSATEDNRCLCIDGTFSPDPSISGCKRHHRCPKGFGVKTLGDGWQDVTCELCSEGMCSDQESSTQKCSLCTNTSLATIATPPIQNTTVTLSDIKITSASSKSDTGMSTIVAGVVGFIIGALTILAIWFGRSRYRRRQQEQVRGHDVERPPPGDGRPTAANLPNGGSIELQNLGSGENPSGGGSEGDPSDNHDVSRNNSRKPLLGKPKGADKKAKESRDVELRIEMEDQKIDNQEPEKEPLLSQCKAFEGANEASGMKKPKVQEEPVEEAQSVVEEAPLAPDEALQHDTQDTSPKDQTGDMTQNQYTEMFREKGYYVTYDPEKDGDCQFSSIAHQMFPHLAKDKLQEKAREIRRRVTCRMEKHPEYFEDFNHRFSGKWGEFIKAMYDKEYGGDPTLQAACEDYGLSIKVIPTKKQNVLKRPRSYARCGQLRDIVLGYIDGGKHYVSLKLIQYDVPAETYPTSDSRVGVDSCSQSDNLSSDLNAQSSSNGSGVQQPSDHTRHEPVPPENVVTGDLQHYSLSPSGNPPSQLNTHSSSESGPQRASSQGAHEPEPMENMTSGDLSLHENGRRALSASSTDNEQNADMRLFSYENDRQALLEVTPDVLRDLLESKESCKKMLRGRHGLQSKVVTSDVKHFIRDHNLLEEIDIDDTEKEYERDQAELRSQLLKKVIEKEGRRLTPRKLLKISLQYKPQKIYDVLCKAFIEHVKDITNHSDD